MSRLFSLFLRACAIVLLLSPASPAVAGDGDVLEQAALARQAYEAGKWEEAKRAYTRLAEQMPDDPEIRFRLGNVYARLGRLDEAAASYQDFLDRQPSIHKGWHNLALVRLHQAMAALAEAGRLGAPQESVPSRRLLDALDAALGDNKPPAPPDCPAVEIPPPQALAAYAAARVNLRQGCGTHHPKLAIVAIDARVEVVAREGDCAQVRMENGQVGWVPLSLLRLAPAEEDKHEP